jgi:hypothetical protein
VAEYPLPLIFLSRPLQAEAAGVTAAPGSFAAMGALAEPSPTSFNELEQEVNRRKDCQERGNEKNVNPPADHGFHRRPELHDKQGGWEAIDEEKESARSGRQEAAMEFGVAGLALIDHGRTILAKSNVSVNNDQ